MADDRIRLERHEPPYTKECPDCKGKGTVKKGWQKCLRCNGEGRVYV